MCTRLWQSTKIVMIMTIVVAMVHADNVKDLNVMFEFPTDSFLSVGFDSAFYNAMFIENKTDHQRIRILDFKDMRTREFNVKMASKFLFSGLLNSGNIIIGCEKNAYLVSKLDGYSAIEMPKVSQFFKDNRITNNTCYNDFNQTALMVYNLNKLSEIDVRLPLEASTSHVAFGTSEAFSNLVILGMQYMSGGTRFAVLYHINNIEKVAIYDQKSKMRINSLGDHVDDSFNMIYNVEMNYLVLVKRSTKSLLIYNSDSLLLEGTINFSLAGLEADKIDSVYSPLGTKIMIITSKFKIYLFCLVTKKFIQEFVFPSDAEKVHWAEGTEYFLTEKKANNKTKFEVFQIFSNDDRYCHKSCNLPCKNVFKPCYNQWMIGLSMALGFMILTLLMICCYFSLVKLVKSTEENQEIVDEQGNLYELTQEGSVRAKRNTITLQDDQLTLPESEFS